MQGGSPAVPLVGEQKPLDKPLSAEPASEENVKREEVGDGKDAEIRPSLRSPARVEIEPSESAFILFEKKGRPLFETEDGQCSRVDETQERQASSHSLQPYALDKAPPPIKTRRDTGLRESSPPDLSPPPSPKRMRELARKEDNNSLAFGNILPSKLSELKSHLSS